MLKFGILALYTVFVLSTRGVDPVQAHTAEAVHMKVPQRQVIINLPLIRQKLRLLLPRILPFPPPHIS